MYLQVFVFLYLIIYFLHMYHINTSSFQKNLDFNYSILF